MERKEVMREMREAGFTWKKIGFAFGVTGERAKQIVKAMPAPSKPAVDPEFVLTPGEVARQLRIHVNTVRRWSNQGILRSYRIGPRHDRRFRPEDIEEFLTGEKGGNNA